MAAICETMDLGSTSTKLYRDLQVQATTPTVRLLMPSPQLSSANHGYRGHGSATANGGRDEEGKEEQHHSNQREHPELQSEVAAGWWSEGEQ